MTQPNPHKCEEALALMRANPGEVWRNDADDKYFRHSPRFFDLEACYDTKFSYEDDDVFCPDLSAEELTANWYRVEDKA